MWWFLRRRPIRSAGPLREFETRASARSLVSSVGGVRVRVEPLVGLARPVPRAGMGFHVRPLVAGIASLAVGGIGAYRRWSPAAGDESDGLLIDRFFGVALAAGLVLALVATLGMLAERGFVPIVYLVSVRGEVRAVLTPYLWMIRVRRADALVAGVSRGNGGGAVGHARAWIRSGSGELSFPLARSTHSGVPTLVVHRPDLVTVP